MLYNTIQIITILIGRLPGDSIDWTGSNRIINIMPLIRIARFHAGESLIIEIKNRRRNRNTGTTSDTSRIHVRLAELGKLCVRNHKNK